MHTRVREDMDMGARHAEWLASATLPPPACIRSTSANERASLASLKQSAITIS